MIARTNVSIRLLLIFTVIYGLGMVISAADSDPLSTSQVIIWERPKQSTETQPAATQPAATQPARKVTVSRAKLEAAEKARTQATKIVESLATAKPADLPGIEKSLADLGDVSMVPLKLATLSDNFELRRRSERLVRRLRWRLVASDNLLKMFPKLIDVMSKSDAKARGGMVEKIVAKAQLINADYDDDTFLKLMKTLSLNRDGLTAKLRTEAGYSIAFLGECLADSQTFVRQRAIDGLVAAANPSGSNTRIAKLLENCLDDDDLNMRLLAVGAMAKIGAVSVDRLAEMLDDESLEVRTTVIRAMGLSDKSTAARHLTPLLKDRQWRIRAASLTALGQLLDSDNAHLVGAQVTELLGDEDEFVRGLATKLIGDLRWKKGLPIILKLLKEGKLDEASGFRALARQEDAAAKVEMLRRYDASSDVPRRIMLLNILDYYDPDVAVDERLGKAIVDESMKSHWPTLFELAMERDKWEGNFPRIAAYMLHADKPIAKGAWESVRYKVRENSLSNDITTKLMASSDPERVAWAMQSAYTSSNAKIVAILKAALNHTDAKVQALALSMIGLVGVSDSFGAMALPGSKSEIVSSLRYYRRDERPNLGKLLAGKSGVRMPAEFIKPVGAKLAHSDKVVSMRAAALLYRSGARADKPVTDILRTGVKSSDYGIRMIALAGITEGAKPFLKDFDLAAAAKDPSTSDRAIEIIANLGDPSYTPVLIEVAGKATYENERLMRMLIRSGDQKASEVVFEKFKKAENWDIERFIERELKGMKGPGPVKFVQWAMTRGGSDKRDLFAILVTLPDPSVKDAIKATIKLYEKDTSPGTRSIRALGTIRLAELDPKNALPELRKMMLSDQQDMVLYALADTKPSDEIVNLLLEVAQTPKMKATNGWRQVVDWLPEKAMRQQFIPAMGKLNWLIQQQLLNRLAGSLNEKDLDLLLAASVKNTLLQESLAAMIALLTSEPSAKRPVIANLKPEALRGVLNAAGDWDNGYEVVMPFVNDTRPEVAKAARRGLAYYALGRRNAKLDTTCRDALLTTVKSNDGIGAYLAAEALGQRWPDALAKLRAEEVKTTAAVARVAVAKGRGLSEAMRTRLRAILSSGKSATGMQLTLIAAAQDYDKSLNINIDRMSEIADTELLIRVAVAAKDPEMIISLLSEGFERPERLLKAHGDLEPLVKKLIEKGRAGDNRLFVALARGGWIQWSGVRPGDSNRVIDCAVELSTDKYTRRGGGLFSGGRGRSFSEDGLSLAIAWTPMGGKPDAKIVKRIPSKQTSGLLAAAVAAVRWNLPEGKKALRDAITTNIRSSSSGARDRFILASRALAICMTPEDAKVLFDSIKVTQKDRENDELFESLGLLTKATVAAAPRETLAFIDRLDDDLKRLFYRLTRDARIAAVTTLGDDWPDKLTDESGKPAKDVYSILLTDEDELPEITQYLKIARGYAPGKDDDKIMASVTTDLLMPPWDSYDNAFTSRITPVLARKRLVGVVARIKSRGVANQKRSPRTWTMLSSSSALFDDDTEDMEDFDGPYSDMEDLLGEEQISESAIVPLVLGGAEVAKALRPLIAHKNILVRRTALRLVSQWRVLGLAPEITRLTLSDDQSEAILAVTVLGKLTGSQAVASAAEAYKRQKDFTGRVRFACLMRRMGSEIGRADIDRAIALKTIREFRLKFVSLATESRGYYRGNASSIDGKMLPWLSDLRGGAVDMLGAEYRRFCLPPSDTDGIRYSSRQPASPKCDPSILYITDGLLTPAKHVSNRLPLTPLVLHRAWNPSSFAKLCAAEQGLDSFFHVQFADKASNLVELHAQWTAWWSANKNKPRDDWWRQGLTQAVEELTHKKWWHRMRAARRLMRLTGQRIAPPMVFDAKGWGELQKTWRAKLTSGASETPRQWLLAAAVEAGALKGSADIKDDAAYLDALVQLAGFADGRLAEAACLRLETWPDRDQLARHCLPWQKSPRERLRNWVKWELRGRTGKQRLMYTSADFTKTPPAATQPEAK